MCSTISPSSELNLFSLQIPTISVRQYQWTQKHGLFYKGLVSCYSYSSCRSKSTILVLQIFNRSYNTAFYKCQVCHPHLLEDKTKVIIPPLKPQNPIFELVKDKDYHLAPVARMQQSSQHQCGFSLSNLKPGDEGIIKTPNFPNDYPPNIQCIWWLKVWQIP